MLVQYPINNVYNNHPSFSGGKINPKNINIEGGDIINGNKK